MEDVLLEKQAQHTGENATLTYALLWGHAIAIPKTLQLVTKPYMERRARAAFEMQWPEKRTQLYVTSPRLNFEEYFTSSQPFEKIVHIMVGDYERIRQYPGLGLQMEQPFSDEVEQAYIRLLRAGYTKHILQKKQRCIIYNFKI